LATCCPVQPAIQTRFAEADSCRRCALGRTTWAPRFSMADFLNGRARGRLVLVRRVEDGRWEKELQNGGAGLCAKGALHVLKRRRPGATRGAACRPVLRRDDVGFSRCVVAGRWGGGLKTVSSLTSGLSLLLRHVGAHFVGESRLVRGRNSASSLACAPGLAVREGSLIA